MPDGQLGASATALVGSIGLLAGTTVGTVMGTTAGSLARTPASLDEDRGAPFAQPMATMGKKETPNRIGGSKTSPLPTNRNGPCEKR
jgi:hypothetical protein